MLASCLNHQNVKYYKYYELQLTDAEIQENIRQLGKVIGATFLENTASTDAVCGPCLGSSAGTNSLGFSVNNGYEVLNCSLWWCLFWGNDLYIFKILIRSQLKMSK